MEVALKKIIIFTSLITVLLLSSCGLPMRYTDVHGSGKLATEERHISGVESVVLSGIGTVIIEQGDDESLEITAEDNILDYLESNVRGSRLTLDTKEFIEIYPTKEITYHLTVKDLSYVGIDGSGAVEMNDLETNDLSIGISGSGKFGVEDLSADTLDADISGSGKMEIAGDVDRQAVNLSGSGVYSAADLSSMSADVNISGSGNAVLWVVDDLELVLSGSGAIEYYGEPVLNVDVSGSGSVMSRGDK